MYKHNQKVAELWTDIEYLTLSYDQSRRGMPTRGDYHELDIIVVAPGVDNRPRHSEVWLGVECKNTSYSKSLLKEILGVRRELSLLTHGESTRFTNWPRTRVNADPPSCLLVFAAKDEVLKYKKPGQLFGIDFFYEPLP